MIRGNSAAAPLTQVEKKAEFEKRQISALNTSAFGYARDFVTVEDESGNFKTVRVENEARVAEMRREAEERAQIEAEVRAEVDARMKERIQDRLDEAAELKAEAAGVAAVTPSDKEPVAGASPRVV